MKKILSLGWITVFISLLLFSACAKMPIQGVEQDDTPIRIWSVSGETVNDDETGKIKHKVLVEVENTSNDETVKFISIFYKGYNEFGEKIRHEQGGWAYKTEYMNKVAPRETRIIELEDVNGFPNAVRYKVWLNFTMCENGEYWQGPLEPKGFTVDFSDKA